MAEEKELQQKESSQVENQSEMESKQTEKAPDFDYPSASREDLVKRLSKLIDSESVLEVKSEIENLKSIFYLKLSKEHAELKAAFLANDGNEEDYRAPQDELESILKSELNRYRKLKNDVYERQEKEREANLKLKEELIEELKELVTKEESLKETFDTFHSIQERWRLIRCS